MIDPCPITHWPAFRERSIVNLSNHYRRLFHTEKRPRVKGVPVIVNGKRYESIAMAADALKIGRCVIENKLKGIYQRHKTQFTVKYA